MTRTEKIAVIASATIVAALPAIAATKAIRGTKLVKKVLKNDTIKTVAYITNTLTA